MDLFRSEEMQLMQLMLPAEYAHDIVMELGDLGMLQFKDLNADKSAFQRTYANQVKRFDEMARKLRFFKDQCTEAGVAIAPRPSMFRKELEVDELEAKVDELEHELLELNANSDRLRRSYNELLELQLVIDRAGMFFDDVRHTAEHFSTRPQTDVDRSAPDAPLLMTDAMAEPRSIRLGFVAGTIPMDKQFAFERLLFRATRGNMYVRFAPVGAVTDPSTGERADKSVFVVFFSGERARAKMLKICEAFGANRYPLPEEASRQRQMSAEISTRIRELMHTMEAGTRYRSGLLTTIGTALESWCLQVLREKAVYHTLNKLSIDVASKVLLAEVWCPVAARGAVKEVLRQAAERAGATVAPVFHTLLTYEMPPTHFTTTLVQQQFQNIIDAYGVARYREANPAVFTMVTFPFLFAVMFGDLGHGIVMLLFAAYLVVNEAALGKLDLGDIVGMMFGGRYLILFMAIFSMYTGALYNEFFSIAMQAFGRQHFVCPTNPALDNPVAMHFDHASCPEAFSQGLVMRPGAPYFFGVDPGWKGSTTELTYLNSIKMKMSIILGVMHMNLGIVLSYFNHKYFGDELSIWCEFIPQMIFLNAMFGYLCFLIILKWLTGSQADLYHVLIYMFLSPGDVDCGGSCPQNVLFPGQGFFQVLLLLAMLVAVPWMLVPKPYILKQRHEKKKNGWQRLSVHDDDSDTELGVTAAGGGHGAHGAHGEEEFEFSEIAVHQMIHTIEFVLGAVSNTASYLRLWALSLAHSQLSAVFYDRVLMKGMSSGPVALLIATTMFFCASMGVLMIMESLSAFLHALRLHWVEFMNKFYHGDGHAHTPFSFKAIDAEPL